MFRSHFRDFLGNTNSSQNAILLKSQVIQIVHHFLKQNTKNSNTLLYIIVEKWFESPYYHSMTAKGRFAQHPTLHPVSQICFRTRHVRGINASEMNSVTILFISKFISKSTVTISAV